MKISGAIFDVDGTLLDSMSIWDTIGADYLRSIGYIPRENLNEIFKNMSLLQAAEYYRNEYGVTLRVEEIMSGVNAMLEQFYQYEAPLKPGAAELLARLRQNRVKQGRSKTVYCHRHRPVSGGGRSGAVRRVILFRRDLHL